MLEEFLGKVTKGDCLSLMKQLPDKCIDLVLTDPPYGMGFRSNYRIIQHDIIQNDNNLDWLPIFVEETFRVLKDNTNAYFFCSFHNIDIFKQQIQKLFTIKNILIWEKNNTGMGDLTGDYAPKYEMIIFCVKGVRKLNGNRDSNIIKYARTNNEYHPTEKPVNIMEYLIKKSSEPDEIVLDCFSGSGTTGAACIKTKRQFIGFELEQKYVDIANKRIQDESRKLTLF